MPKATAKKAITTIQARVAATRSRLRSGVGVVDSLDCEGARATAPTIAEPLWPVPGALFRRSSDASGSLAQYAHHGRAAHGTLPLGRAASVLEGGFLSLELPLGLALHAVSLVHGHLITPFPGPRPGEAHKIRGRPWTASVPLCFPKPFTSSTGPGADGAHGYP